MHERQIEYTNTPSIIIDEIKSHSKEITTHSFGFYHDITPKMNVIKEDQTEEEVKFEEIREDSPKKKIQQKPKQRKDRLSMYKSNKIRSSAIQAPSITLGKTNNNENRPRSKSPAQEENAEKAKVVNLDSDSDHEHKNNVKYESEVKIPGINFDTSSDDNKDSDEELNEAEGDDALINEEDIKFTQKD